MIMNKKNLVVIGWLVVSTMMSAQSVYPGQHQGKMKKEKFIKVNENFS